MDLLYPLRSLAITPVVEAKRTAGMRGIMSVPLVCAVLWKKGFSTCWRLSLMSSFAIADPRICPFLCFCSLSRNNKFLFGLLGCYLRLSRQWILRPRSCDMLWRSSEGSSASVFRVNLSQDEFIRFLQNVGTYLSIQAVISWNS